MTRGISTASFQRFFLSKIIEDINGNSIIGIKYLVSSNKGIMKSNSGFERKLLINIKQVLSIISRISIIILAASLEI